MRACASLVRTVVWWPSAPFPATRALTGHRRHRPPVSKRARLQLKNSITTGKKTNMLELLYTTYALVAILPYVGIVACIKVGAL